MIDSDIYIICAGILDEPDRRALTSQIFIDEKPVFYDFANETMTGAEVFAMYAPPPDKD